jgi:hypothetical protein
MAGMVELRPGVTVQCGDHRYLITHLLDLESVLAREEQSGEIERLYLKDLAATQPDDPSDSIQACELSSVDEADWQTAEERFATIRPLLGDVRAQLIRNRTYAFWKPACFWIFSNPVRLPKAHKLRPSPFVYR